MVNADAMVSLLRLKTDVEGKSQTSIKLVFAGAQEAHILAELIAEAGVGVIVAPSRPFPHSWEERRM